MIADKLNMMYGNFLINYSKPVRVDFSKGLTEIPSDNIGVIELNPPAYGNIKLEKIQTGGVVARLAFSYDDAVKMTESYEYGVRLLSVLQNEILIAMSPWINWDNPLKQNLFHRKGQPMRFFIETEQHAAFEIRAMYDGTSEV